MHRIFAIALNTFRENRRDRVLYVMLAFAVLLVVASLLLGQLSPIEQTKILLDVGQSSIQLIGVLIAVFLGVGLVAKEIERRTVYVIVSKPVLREEFLLGKFLGLAITLGLSVAFMSALLALMVGLHGHMPTLAVLQSAVLMYVEFLLITAAALLFSSFSTTTLAAIYSAGVWILGHVTNDIRILGAKSESRWVQVLSKIAYHVLPNLEALNAKAYASHDTVLSAGEFSLAALYGLIYTAVFLILAVIVFARRDFR